MEKDLSKNDLQVLVQIASELATQINLAELFQLILAKAGNLTESPDGAILLYNTDRNSLYFAGAIGTNSSLLMEKFGEFAKEQVPLHGSKAGNVFSSGKSIIVDRIDHDKEHYKGVDMMTSHSTESMLCTPLKVRDEQLGVIQLLNKRSGNYTLRDKLLLEQFSKYAAIALRNAHLFEELIAHMGLYSSRESSGDVTELLHELKRPARLEKLTVLFADMRGFRLLCQVINDPERILHISSEFITMLSGQVLLNGGIVNKFLGDGILALFREKDYAERAVKCAFSMINEFNELKKIWDNESIAQLDFLDIGIGIATDNVIIGTVGNSKIHDFTALGNAVNLAAAFEKEARGGKHILVDHFTYMAVKDMVSVIEGPFDYELRQPDQKTGNTYKQYHLKQLSKIKKNTVFISHNESDREFIENDLIPFFNKNKIRYWYSKNNINGGDSWVTSISKGLEISTWFLVLISKSSLNSTWVKEEIDMAAARTHLINKIVPIQLDDTKLEEVSSFLIHKQSINSKNKDLFFMELLQLLT